MIKDNQKHFNRLQVLLDAAVIVLSYICAWLIQTHVIVHGSVGMLPAQMYMSALIFIVPGFLILYYAFNLYTPKRVQGRRLEASNVFLANALGMLGIMFVLYLIRQQDFSRTMLFLFIGINIVATVIERNIIRRILRDIRSRGMNLNQSCSRPCKP